MWTQADQDKATALQERMDALAEEDGAIAWSIEFVFFADDPTSTEGVWLMVDGDDDEQWVFRAIENAVAKYDHWMKADEPE